MIPLIRAAPSRAQTQPAQAPAEAAPGGVPDSPIDGRAFRAKTLKLKYYGDLSQDRALPSPERLMAVPLALGITPEGHYVVPAGLEQAWFTLNAHKLELRHLPTERVRMSDVKDTPAVYYQSAVWAICKQITQELSDRHILGVYVMPSPEQINWEDYSDKRASDDQLEFWVYTGRVKDVRSFASGERVPASRRKNAREHQWIREHSPVKPAPGQGQKQPTGAAAATDLLRGDLLDEYIFSLNRHPGRHVDVAVSAFSPDTPGDVTLDYLVTESKPWSAYFQFSNTGTKATSEWRERFGFISNQFTGRDDTFTLDYTTAGFTDFHDVVTSYDFPVGDTRKVRVRAFANFNQFTASDVGQAGLAFDGRQAGGGAEAILNVYQHRDHFIDLVAGARYEYNNVDNPGAGSTGTANYIVPYSGLRYDRISEVSSVLADLMFVGRFSNANADDLNSLGRLNADQDAFLIQADGTWSFFLEPLFKPKEFREANTHLAQEMVISGRAQYSFNRLIPAAEEVAGGLYSVRGYPESISAGDTVLIGSAEYRFHLPRILPVKESPERNRWFPGQPFRWQPQQVYGRPDWDLILRGFVDVGRTVNVERESFEHNQTLVGTGVGVQLDIKQNISVRVDGGVALNGVPDEVERGDARVHFVLTLLY